MLGFKPEITDFGSENTDYGSENLKNTEFIDFTENNGSMPENLDNENINPESAFELEQFYHRSGYQGFEIYNDDISTKPKFSILYIVLPLLLAVLATLFSLHFFRRKRSGIKGSNNEPNQLRIQRKNLSEPQVFRNRRTDHENRPNFNRPNLKKTKSWCKNCKFCFE